MHEELCDLLDNRNVYYNPPESVKMRYPCIRYSLSGLDKHNANDKMYKSMNRYEVTTIEHDPDSDLHDKLIGHFPMCSFNRAYNADGLCHKSYTIYY